MLSRFDTIPERDRRTDRIPISISRVRRAIKYQDTGCTTVLIGNCYHLLTWYCVRICKQQQAAATTVYCATSTDIKSHSAFYFNNCFQCTPSPEATNAATAKWLWELSEQMIARAKTLDCKPTIYEVWEICRQCFSTVANKLSGWSIH